MPVFARLLLGLTLGWVALPAWTANHTASELVYVGTRGSAPAPSPGALTPSGDAPGIYAVRLDPATGELASLGNVAQLDRAQWLSIHPDLPVLYAVANGTAGPNGDSDIYSFALDPESGRLTLLNKVDSGGRDATHTAVDARTGTLFSANHGSDTGSPPPLVAGSVSDMPIHADGSLGELVSSHEEAGSGPNPQRQRNAQVHCVAMDPSGQFVLTADLGADRIFIYRFDRATRALEPVGFEPLPPGSGPRHLLFDRTGRYLYLNTELSARVHVFRWDARHGRLQALQTVEGYPADYAGTQERSSSEIALSRDGRFLYFLLRGDQNSIVVYAVERSRGTLQEIQRVAAGGKGSRGLAIDPTGAWLLVVNDTNTLTELRVDALSGQLTATNNSLPIPRPAAVLFYGR